MHRPSLAHPSFFFLSLVADKRKEEQNGNVFYELRQQAHCFDQIIIRRQVLRGHKESGPSASVSPSINESSLSTGIRSVACIYYSPVSFMCDWTLTHHSQKKTKNPKKERTTEPTGEKKDEVTDIDLSFCFIFGARDHQQQQEFRGRPEKEKKKRNDQTICSPVAATAFLLLL